MNSLATLRISGENTGVTSGPNALNSPEPQFFLTERERHLIAAQELAEIGSWEYDVSAGRVYGSAETFRLIEHDVAKYGEPDLITLRRRYHPEDRKKHIEATARALRGETYDIEVRLLREDGSIRWLHSRGYPVFGADGTVRRVFGILQDITTRKETEENLRHSEQRFRLLVEATSSVTWRIDNSDIDHIRVMAWRAFTGQTEEEERNGGWVSTIHPEDRDQALKAIRRNFEERKPGMVEYRVRRWDGIYRWFRNAAVPIFDAEGTLIEWIGNSLDITEEKEAEAARTRRAAEMKEVLDLMPQQAFMARSGTRLVFVNRRVYEYFGLPLDASLNEIDWMELIHPDDVAIARETRRREREENRPFSYEIRILRHDGMYRWHQYRIVPILTDTGEVDHVIGTATDIQGLKEEEEARAQREREMREILDMMTQIAYAAKADATVLYFNRRFYEYVGLPPDTPPHEVNWLSVVHPEDQSGMIERARSLPKRREPYDYEVRIRRHDGVFRWHHFRSVPILNAEGSALSHVISTGTDISEQKEREAEYERLRLEAEEKVGIDPLTGLPNHRTFYQLVEDRALQVQNNGGQFALVMLDLDNLKLLNDTYSVEAGDRVICQVATLLKEQCDSTDIVARVGGDEFGILTQLSDFETVQTVTERLRGKLQIMQLSVPGEKYAVPIRLSLGVCLFPLETLNFKEAIYQANRRCILDKNTNYDYETDLYRQALAKKSQGFAMLNALVAAIDNKDTYTMRHSADVMRYALWIAEGLGLSSTEKDGIRVAALLHDVGKIGIPFRLLRTPGPLSPEERHTVEQHVTIGALLVGSIPELALAQDTVKYHHERWDGKGYPSGIHGEEIPLNARIVAVADALSAMTVDRPYRKGMILEDALTILENGSGTQWDPLCVKVLLDWLRGNLDWAKKTL